jgi:hypothetical protein
MISILLASLLLAFPGQTAPAPSDAQRLQEAQAENQKLRDELAAARERIRQLEAANGTKAPGAAPADKPAAPAADATADLMGNPIAVLDFFKKKFAEDMAKRHVAMPQEKDSKQTRQLYVSRVKDWTEANNRVTYGVEWRGRITGFGAAKGGSQELEFQCVSPDNRNNFGRAVQVSVNRGAAPQLGASAPDRESIWIMSATLVPMLSVAPDQLEPNTFDQPPLVGPCATLKYQLKVTRLYPEKAAAAPPMNEN